MSSSEFNLCDDNKCCCVASLIQMRALSPSQQDQVAAVLSQSGFKLDRGQPIYLHLVSQPTCDISQYSNLQLDCLANINLILLRMPPPHISGCIKIQSTTRVAQVSNSNFVRVQYVLLVYKIYLLLIEFMAILHLERCQTFQAVDKVRLLSSSEAANLPDKRWLRLAG